MQSFLQALYFPAWYFVLYSFLGWCLEVCFCTVVTGKWVNRGFLNGPVCPIYGFGMRVITAVLGPLQQNLLLLSVLQLQLQFQFSFPDFPLNKPQNKICKLNKNL